jgi:hypothetical protein
MSAKRGQFVSLAESAALRILFPRAVSLVRMSNFLYWPQRSVHSEHEQKFSIRYSSAPSGIPSNCETFAANTEVSYTFQHVIANVFTYLCSISIEYDVFFYQSTLFTFASRDRHEIWSPDQSRMWISTPRYCTSRQNARLSGIKVCW